MAFLTKIKQIVVIAYKFLTKSLNIKGSLFLFKDFSLERKSKKLVASLYSSNNEICSKISSLLYDLCVKSSDATFFK